MAHVELNTVEVRDDGQLLVNVRVTANTGKIEFPILVKDRGSVAANETAVLRSALEFAKELESAIQLRAFVSADK